METLCQKYHLLTSDDGIIRVPFLIKGCLVVPPEIDRAQVEAAFASAQPEVGYVKLAQAQLLREPVIDPSTLRYTGSYQYQVLPSLNPEELIEMDFGRLLAGPYSLRVTDILDYLKQIAGQLQDNWATVERVHQLCANTSQQPRPYLDGAFAALLVGLDGEAARNTIDNELAAWGFLGSQFLDGWVEVAGQVIGYPRAGTNPGTGSARQRAGSWSRSSPDIDPSYAYPPTAYHCRQRPGGAAYLGASPDPDQISRGSQIPVRGHSSRCAAGTGSLRGGSRPSYDSKSFGNLLAGWR